MRPFRFALAAAVVAMMPVGAAQSSVDPSPSLDVPVKGWTAVAGMSGPAVIAMARDLNISTEASSDQPWCDRAAVVDSALKSEFEELPVTYRADGTELWGSALTGTWTVVLSRPDNVQCVIASGIGYQDGTDPAKFYAKVGLS